MARMNTGNIIRSKGTGAMMPGDLVRVCMSAPWGRLMRVPDPLDRVGIVVGFEGVEPAKWVLVSMGDKTSRFLVDWLKPLEEP